VVIIIWVAIDGMDSDIEIIGSRDQIHAFQEDLNSPFVAQGRQANLFNRRIRPVATEAIATQNRHAEDGLRHRAVHLIA
jgi:hypothetical protein